MISRNPGADTAMVFPALLSPRFRLFSQTLGYGAGIVLPLLVGLGAAALYGEYWALALPLPFLLLIGIASLFRPRAYRIGTDRFAVLRSIGAIEWQIADIKTVRVPPIWPQSRAVAVMAMRGLFGTYGWFWNREWGTHRLYLTDLDKAIEIERANGQRIVVTPDDTRGFVSALETAARRAGAAIEIERGR